MSWEKPDKDVWQLKDNILMGIVGITFFLNLLLPLFIPIVPISEELELIGVILLVIGIVFVVLSIVTLRGKGVNALIDTGLYGILRHPMYVGAMILFLAHPFLIQHWIVVISSLIAIICMHETIHLEEQRNLEKFGEEYKPYKQTVPRINFLVGIIRRLRR